MKRIISLLICIIVIGCLCGCSAQKSSLELKQQEQAYKILYDDFCIGTTPQDELISHDVKKQGGKIYRVAMEYNEYDIYDDTTYNYKVVFDVDIETEQKMMVTTTITNMEVK